MANENQLRKNKIMAAVMTMANEKGIDIENIPDFPELAEFSVEDLLARGEIEYNSLMQKLNTPREMTPEETEKRVVRLAAVLKAVEGREPKSRAEIAAQEH